MLKWSSLYERLSRLITSPFIKNSLEYSSLKCYQPNGNVLQARVLPCGSVETAWRRTWWCRWLVVPAEVRLTGQSPVCQWDCSEKGQRRGLMLWRDTMSTAAVIKLSDTRQADCDSWFTPQIQPGWISGPLCNKMWFLHLDYNQTVLDRQESTGVNRLKVHRAQNVIRPAKQLPKAVRNMLWSHWTQVYNANAFPIYIQQLCGWKYVSEVVVKPGQRQEVVAGEEEVEKEAGNVDATCWKKMSNNKMVVHSAASNNNRRKQRNTVWSEETVHSNWDNSNHNKASVWHH